MVVVGIAAPVEKGAVDPSWAPWRGVLVWRGGAAAGQIRLVTVPLERIILTRVDVPGAMDVKAAVRSERIAIETTRPRQ